MKLSENIRTEEKLSLNLKIELVTFIKIIG